MAVKVWQAFGQAKLGAGAAHGHHVFDILDQLAFSFPIQGSHGGLVVSPDGLDGSVDALSPFAPDVALLRHASLASIHADVMSGGSLAPSLTVIAPGGGGTGGSTGGTGGTTTGTSGDDNLVGTSGNDTIDGLGGNDTINGLGGNDILHGSDGNDTVIGGTGADTIDGGAGDDILYSDAASAMDHGTEVDTITGGDGSDTIYAGYGDNVDGGADGYYGDTLYISFQGATQGIHFDAHLATQTIGGGTITGIENIGSVEGSNYSDYIDVGSSTNNGYSPFTTVYGMGGDDTIIAGYYTGHIDGGDGNDIIDGRASEYMNEIDGGAGDDTIYAPTNENFCVTNGGAGNDTIYSNYEAHGGDGNDTIVMQSGYYEHVATGDAGDDNITGTDSGDNIQGNDGNDTLNGGAGDDILNGGAGDDVLTGGAGNDQFYVGQGNDIITDFTSGDSLHIQANFSASSISQVGADVVVALSSGDKLTIQNSDVATVEAALQSSVHLNDVAISPDGSTIYGAGDDGNLYVYSAATGEFIKAYHIGTELGGLDVSADGSFAVVTELQPLTSSYDPNNWTNDKFTAAVYKIDLSTGDVTTYTTTLTGDEYAFYDASILNNGQVLLTEQILPGWSGWAPMRTLDLSTGKFTADTSGQITEDSLLFDGGHGVGALVSESNISDAHMEIYTAGTGVTAGYGGSGFNHGVQAYNAEAGLVAQGLGTSLYIYNGQLQYQFDLGQRDPQVTAGGVAGVAFDSTGHYLFVLNVQNDVIYQVSTSDWSIVNTISVGVDVTSSDGGFGNRLVVSPDMTYFTVLTDSGGLVEVAMPTNLSATDNADFLLGTSAADSINGAGGNDSIYGAAGNDTINGGTGDDVISGGAGNDTLTGGGGNDTFLFKLGDGTDVITDFAAGDGVDVSGYTSAQSVTQVGSNVVVVFDNGDQITFDNTTVSTVQAGLHFLDTPAPTQTPVDPPENLVGTSGNDTLVGGSGNDTLTGLGGNDILNGGAGADTMIGGTGNDTYYVDNPGDVVTEQSGQGTDTVHSTISYTLPNNVENGTLDGTAAINLTGNGLANTLHGNSGDNFLYGMAGNDILVGGAGNDTLRGGLGADTLTGGTGSDTFQFEASNGNDKITDFQSGVDKLDFHLLGITSSSVKEVVSGGNLLLKVDANHDGIVDFTITLTGVTHVVASDFIW